MSFENGKNYSTRDWAGVPDYLLEEVTERLPLADCLLSFGSVCKSWRSATVEYLNNSDRVVPCLVKRGENVNQVMSRSCFSIFGNFNFKMDLPEAYRNCIWGSFQDWLFLGRVEKSRLLITFLNPFSGESIQLPGVLQTYHLMVLSKAPSEEKCVCMLVGVAGDVQFWNPGSLKSIYTNTWTLHILDAVYCRGCFYLLTNEDKIFIVNEENVLCMMDTGTSIDALDILVQSFLSVKLPKSQSQVARHYLVESCGEILLICRGFYSDDEKHRITSEFETYRLDLENMAWSKLSKLDDHIILFLGTSCSKSFHAKDLGETFSNKVYFINEIYLVHINEWLFYDFRAREVLDGDDWGLFSFKKSNHWPSVFQARSKYLPGIWLTVPVRWCFKHRSR